MSIRRAADADRHREQRPVRGAGTLTATAGNRELGDEDRSDDLAAGRYVVIGLEDTGGGIAPEVLPRTLARFEPEAERLVFLIVPTSPTSWFESATLPGRVYFRPASS